MPGGLHQLLSYLSWPLLMMSVACQEPRSSLVMISNDFGISLKRALCLLWPQSPPHQASAMPWHAVPSDTTAGGEMPYFFVLMPYYYSWFCMSLDADIFEKQKLQLLFRIIFFSKFLLLSYIAGRFRKTNQYVCLTLPQQELFRRLGLGHFPRSGKSISRGLCCQYLLPS